MPIATWLESKRQMMNIPTFSWICKECAWEGHLSELCWVQSSKYVCPDCQGEVQYVGQTDHE